MLASILNATGLSSEFNNPTLKGTLFAPINGAILRYLPQPDLDDVLAAAGGDRGNGSNTMSSPPSFPLQALVLLHAVPSALNLQGLEDGMQLPSFLSSTTQLNDGKGLLTVQRLDHTLTGAAVTYAGTQAGLIVSDIAACGSVVHVVDNLLLPKPTSKAPSFQPSSQDVLDALSQTGATSQISASWQPKVDEPPTADTTAAPTQSGVTGPPANSQQPLSDISLTNLSGSPGGDSGGGSSGGS